MTNKIIIMNFRIEKDTMGEVQVPAEKYWGAQTERSRNNFKIGEEGSMPREIIEAFAYLKKAAAYANCDLGVLPLEKRDLIAQVCDEILSGKLADQFPLVIWQTGSGTQSNMNINEVISNRAHVLNGGTLGEKSSYAKGMIPSFPSKTFPNHYTIITGMYPGSHGLVDNKFYAPAEDKIYSIPDRQAVQNPKFYGGMPQWQWLQKNGMKTASYFWVGSEAPIQG